MTSAPPHLTAEQTYEGFAPYYDRFTSDNDYELWTATLEGIAKRHGLAGRRLLDIACGTGKSFMPLLRRGYAVTACDISAEMVGRAARKCQGEDVRLLVADMRALPRLGQFDFVTCIDDALNYLLTDADLEAAFRCAAANLAPNGVYLFDVNSLATYRSFFAGLHLVEEEDLLLLWRGQGEPDMAPGGASRSTVEAFERRNGGWRRSSIHHRQRHHPEPVVRRRLAAAGLDCLAVYGQHHDGSVEPTVDEQRHTKIVFVAQPAT